jgi:hypothetical protein
MRWVRAMGVQGWQFWAIGFAAVALPGCQGTPLAGMANWNQATRVPPPATGSFEVPGAYSGGTGMGTNAASPAPRAECGTRRTRLPLVPICDDREQSVRQSNDRCSEPSQTGHRQRPRCGVSIHQPGARPGRPGQCQTRPDRQRSCPSGQVVSDAFQDPPPGFPLTPGAPSGYALEGSGYPGTESSSVAPASAPSNAGASTAPPASGRIGDTVEDPNAQWRKPTPR